MSYDDMGHELELKEGMKKGVYSLSVGKRMFVMSYDDI
jgi:hypothetical protein